jgi:hypothetical protein
MQPHRRSCARRLPRRARPLNLVWFQISTGF